jgi:chemotaxis regulatin CheY-phosphate phosphatase CheZ
MPGKAMTSLTPSPQRDLAAYEQIESAVMETERGRWFLEEFARRHRHSETEMVLEAIDKLSRSLHHRPVMLGSDALHRDILDMARAIVRAEKEIRAMRNRDGGGLRFAAAGDALDSVVDTTEQATSSILSAAEQIQELAWTMREAGIEPELCDRLDSSATAIYTACGFQDLTAQRIAKAVETLKFLDQRIRKLVDAAGLTEEIADEIADIDATIAMEPPNPEADIWLSEAHQAEIDETFDFFVPAERSEPTMVGADLLELEASELKAAPQKASGASKPKASPAPAALTETVDQELFVSTKPPAAEHPPLEVAMASPSTTFDDPYEGLSSRDRLGAFR